jgi:protein SCO1/2
MHLRHLTNRLVTLAFLSAAISVAAEQPLPPQLEGVDVVEKLGRNVDLDLQFTAENGYQVPLRSFFHQGKPVILNLVYYTCPMLCNLVLNGQLAALKDVAWTAGDQFEVVTISIDPNDNFGIASKKKALYLEEYGKAGSNWHFMTDYKGNVKRLAEQVGFRYRFDEKQQQYAHAAAIMFLTPDGVVSRYLYGVKFKPRDVRLALTEASEGKLGTAGDKILLFCFHYDPEARSYVPFARNIMRAGGVGIVLVLGFILYFLWRGERRRTLAAHELVTAK